VLFEQHGPPAFPQGAHTDVLVLLLELFTQAFVVSWHAPPVDELEQQACPVPPQTLQM
jgi:hypothetical protein